MLTALSLFGLLIGHSLLSSKDAAPSDFIILFESWDILQMDPAVSLSSWDFMILSVSDSFSSSDFMHFIFLRFGVIHMRLLNFQGPI